MKNFHLAQINIARLRAPVDDPLLADFVAKLDEINALAESTPGFVWRLQSDSGNATDIQAFEDDSILINMSVWDLVESLHAYTYKTDHAGLFRGRKKWFEPMEGPTLALWWVPAGHLPTAREGRERVELLAEMGPTPAAFTMRQTFPPPG